MTAENPPREPATRPLRFKLVRHRDDSGVSGTGTVAFGVLWPDGAVDIQWRNDDTDGLDTTRNGFASYHSEDGLDDTLAVHGHGGATEVVFIDGPAQGDTLD
jgi:hypothetical protein